MFSLGDIATILGAAPPRRTEARPARVVHDSRHVGPGDLFVAIPGARVDGHAFLDDAFRRGACGAIVSDPACASRAGVILVEDTVGALQKLASAWRDRLRAPLVAVTGSHGKTTTRTLLAHLLRASRSVREPPENYNTEIGLPLALLSMAASDDLGVFELGALRPGDIALLASILRPSAAVLTGIGPSHLGGFGSLEAIADEKWSLVRALQPSGIAFLNADSPELVARVPSAPCAVRTAGVERGDLRGRIEVALPKLVVRVDDPPMRLETPLLGEHNAPNVLLAAACALHFEISPTDIERAMRSYAPPPHRLRAISSPFGVLLDDTYNANPASTAAALRVLAGSGKPSSRRLFVFGDMLDLGDESGRFHREIVELAISLGIDLVLPAGERAAEACAGLTRCRSSLVEARDRADALRRELEGAENLVLVKGSRALGLDRLVAELADDPHDPA
jgi:UDP-N-acetylmuramoyl-tripeptide--D-alanyl-D-alanine ligase